MSEKMGIRSRSSAKKIKIVGHGYRTKGLPTDNNTKTNLLKTVVIVATGQIEADGTKTLYLIDAIHYENDPPFFCYYDLNEKTAAPLNDFKFYHGGKINLKPVIGHP